MKSPEKEYQIYLKSGKQWVSVTETEYKNYFRDINAFRRKEQRHCCCTCPHEFWWQCDMDCEVCKYHLADDMLSIDAELDSDDGSANYESFTPDMTVDVESAIFEVELLDALHQRLSELDPESMRICQAVMDEKSERKRAEKLGMSRKKFKSEWEKIKDSLYSSLEDYI